MNGRNSAVIGFLSIIIRRQPKFIGAYRAQCSRGLFASIIVIFVAQTFLYAEDQPKFEAASTSDPSCIPSVRLAALPQAQKLYQQLPFLLSCNGSSLHALEESQLVSQIQQILEIELYHRRAQSALRDFLTTALPANLDPVQMIVLQHDLWGIYESVTRYQPNSLQELRDLLSQAIQKIALSEDQLNHLSGNYKRELLYPPSPGYSPGSEAFLPPDLLEADGSWMNLEFRYSDGAAPFHEQMVNGRSVFTVHMKYPDTRQEALKYFERVNTFENPWLPVPRQTPPSDTSLILRWNSAMPQFPDGTTVALVRRMLAISNQGKLWATPVVESIQMRIFDKVISDSAVPLEYKRSLQRAFEFRLSRADLDSGHSGMLLIDQELEIPRYFADNLHLQKPISRSPQQTRGDIFNLRCQDCHHGLGILSFNSFLSSFQSNNNRVERPMPNSAPKIELQALSNSDYWAVRRKASTFEYGYLRAWFDTNKAKPKAKQN